MLFFHYYIRSLSSCLETIITVQVQERLSQGDMKEWTAATNQSLPAGQDRQDTNQFTTQTCIQTSTLFNCALLF